MNEIYNDTENVTRFLKWISQNRKYWQIICTPNDERMTRQMMKKLIKILLDESLYELIFVMLCIHRKEAFVNDILMTLTIYMISTRWKNEKKNIIRRILNYL